MDKQIKQLIKIFNLSKYEAKLYLAALNFNNVNLSDLSRKAGLPRTAAYEPIKRLLNEGFLTAIKIKKRTYYSAVDPRKLKFILERKKVELDDMVTGLEKQINLPERKLAVSCFTGQIGIEMATDIILEEARTKKGKSWEALDGNILPKSARQLNSYIERRVKKGIKGEMIVAGDPEIPALKKILAKDKEELRKSLIINPKKYPIKSAILVLDDSVIIFTFGNNPFAILIKNKDIATTMWSIHSMFWDRYNK